MGKWIRSKCEYFVGDHVRFWGLRSSYRSGEQWIKLALRYARLRVDWEYFEDSDRQFPDPGAVPGRMPLMIQDHWSDGYISTRNSSFDTPVSSTTTPTLPVPLPGIYDISPKLVEKDSRVNITVHGQNFERNKTFCHFSSQPEPVPAIVKSHAVALCAFDGSLADPGSISLSLSLNRARPSLATEAFLLLNRPTVASIYPRRGPLEGNSTILVTGTGFAATQALYCHFDGQAKVRGQRLTDTMLQCVTPPSRSGRDSDLRVSINSSIYSSNSTHFLYQDMPRLESMSPSYGSVEGDVSVVIRGRWLNASEDVVLCAFGASRVATVTVNSTTVIAKAPRSAVGVGAVSVKCTLNGEVITPTEFAYRYLQTPRASRVTPQMGLAFSNTRILVDGTGFSEKYPMTCHFDHVSFPAVVLSPSQVECIAPPHSEGVVNASVTLSGSPVGQAVVAFEYIAEPKLLQVMPPLGSETGSTKLLIIGERFTRRAEMSCSFSRQDDVTTVTTTAFWAGEGLYICHTPPFSPGPAYVQLAVVEPQVFSVSPQRSSAAGDALVTITGAGFIDSELFRCKLGSTIVRPVKFESESRVTCKFPRPIQSGVLPVRVSNNKQDFTTDPVLFELHAPVVVDYATPLYGLVDEEATKVDLMGHNFHELEDLECQIIQESANVRATAVAIFASAAISTCSLPTPKEVYSLSNVSVSMLMTLRVQEVGQTNVIFEAPFRYLARPILLAAFPTLLLVTGGQTVWIEGVNLALDIDLMCQFESYYPYDQVPFVVFNRTHGSCVTPERSPGLVDVRLCFRGVNRCSLNSITVSYVRVPVVHKMVPSFRLEAERSLISVIGNDFCNVPMHCDFDGVRTLAAFVNQSLVECPDSLFQRHKCAKFSLLVDGVNVLDTPLDFCSQVAPLVNLIRPRTGPERGGTRVLVSGGPFTTDSGYSCRFGDVEVPADYLSTSQLFCISPPSRGLTVAFSVSGVNFSISDGPKLTFTYRPAPVASGINPTRGSEEGQYVVTVQGLNFVRGAGLRCRFGVSAVVAGRWLSDTSISCAVPPHQPGWVDIQVTNNLQDYSIQPLRFEYVVSPTVLSFEPRTMYAQHPTELIIHGRDFQNSSDVRCIIGNDLSPAAFLSETRLKCAPAILVETSVVIGVVDFSLSMVGAFAHDRLKVLDDGVWSLRPRVTSVRGETPIVLSRRSNDEPLEFEVVYGRFCSRNEVVCSELTVASRLETNKLRWFPPRWTGPDLMGVVEIFRLTNVSMVPTAPVASFPYRYCREVELKSITPSIGSVTGGTVVTLSGNYFQDGHNLSCVMNAATFVSAQFITDTMVSCTIPAYASGPREIRVFVSLNGLEVSKSSLAFKYVEDPSVFSIFPTGGPITGTTMVSVVGAHFVSTSKSECSFGYHSVPAIVVSSTEVTCIVQPSSWPSIGSLRFRFSSNGQDFSRENVSYFIYEDPVLLDMSPRVGSVSGGTKLTFTWDQEVPIEYFGNVSCQIGSIAVDEVLVTKTTASIVVPAAQSSLEGPVTTRLSLNGQNYIDGPQLWYFLEPRFDSIYPNSSGETTRTWIRIAGEKFPRLTTLSCWFGRLDSVMVSAEWVSDKLVLCRAPAHRPGTVDFGFSINGVDVIGTKLQFTFTPKTLTRDFYPISGPNSGGSELTIPVDSDFQHCRRVHCIVGALKAVAVPDNTNAAVKCTMPPQDKAQEVSIAVECDGQSRLELERKFSYFNAPIISEIEPRSMSLALGGIISARGRNFPDSTVYCRFDSNSVTTAIAVSDSEVRCVAPAFSSHAVFSYIALEISTNGVDFTTSGTKIQLTPSLDVTAMGPRHAIVNQEVEVLVYTTGLIINPGIFTCRVGEAYQVPASIASHSSIRCRLPAVSSPGQVTVAVSNNGIDFVGGSHTTLFYHAVPIVHAISQSSGSVFGGENVVVSGRGFVSEVEMSCVFGNTNVKATYLHEDAASCLVPPSRWLVDVQGEYSKSSSKVVFKLGTGLDSSVSVLEQESEWFWTYQLPIVDVDIHPTRILTGRSVTVHVKGLNALSLYTMRLVLENDKGAETRISLVPSSDERIHDFEGELELAVAGRYEVEIEDSGGKIKSW
ncbi:uncharacterized protein PITG_02133 [Phytophthora infestans T30-4]|uniref:IPT/TIG domain-containing protein n=1 Tax=Phytophthora infestans (strain T30-4) TaxID=403677 RepID=D0MVK2_PHYIT|nr:uncharacterized protein PITG_02133 [Phytophthora infestans T30-4]EEY63665.1 conserved hypothetical protein [Phytophthora infestans T30-4]|eukprot:XP_002907101.1 conserved hypothetical protein [Phytophthora infestans T30-4]